jgi:hypothetical protein
MGDEHLKLIKPLPARRGCSGACIKMLHVSPMSPVSQVDGSKFLFCAGSHSGYPNGYPYSALWWSAGYGGITKLLLIEVGAFTMGM